MELRSAVAEALSKLIGTDVHDLLEEPPEEHGDYALPCFTFARERKQSPPIIARELAEKVRTGDLIVRAEAVGPYLNLFLNRAYVAQRVVTDARAESYGKRAPRGERVMVEYSQPNTHKAFHVGHLRGTSMGESLSRILRYAGFDVIQANYSGDTGMHVAKWLWCYTKYHADESPGTRPGKWLAEIYVDAVKRLVAEPELQQEVDAINLALDTGEDEKLMAMWKQTRQWSIDELNEHYAELDAHFDEWFFESGMESRAKEVARELVEKGIAKESDGAIIVDLEDDGLGVWVLLRKDGTPLYSAKDIALAEQKFTRFRIDRSIYVVGNEQALHMRQLFRTLEQMGFPQADKCFHLGYDLVRRPEGKMSSRTGQNILYTDLREEVFRVTEQEIHARHEEWDAEKIAATVRAVGVCALKFEMVFRDVNKPIIFDAEKVCDFEGDTGPYLQYTHARCNSILLKLDRKLDRLDEAGALTADAEYRVVRQLQGFPGVVEEVAKGYQISLIAKYALELAKLFNSFYHECRVVGDEKEGARAQLVDATRAVLARCLDLLGIAAPKEM